MKLDKTPTGPTSKKQKTGGTRMRALSAEFKQSGNKENVDANITKTNKRNKSTQLSTCKDVTSRGLSDIGFLP